MALPTGRNTYVGLGVETSYGTEATPDTFLRMVSETLQHIKEPFKTDSLNDDWHSVIYYGAGRNEGDLVIEQQYEGTELLWWSLLGDYTFNADTPSTGANQHIFQFSPPVSPPTGLTIQPVRDIGGSDEMSYLGMKVQRASIELTPRQIVRTTFGLVGTGYAKGTATAASFPTFRPVLPAHKATMTIGGTTFTIRSGTVEIEIPRPNDREHYGESLYKEPVIQGRPMATYSFELEHSDDTGNDSQARVDDYLDEADTGSLVITHEGDTIPGSSAPHSLTLTGSGSYVTSPGPNVQGPGITTFNVEGEIVSNFTVTLENGANQAT